MTPDWLAIFAGYDDAALVALANAGLLRRARKDLAAGEVSLTSQSAAEAVVAVGIATVRLGPRGPVAATCSCPTAGVCQHVVAACLWARDRATADVSSTTGPATTGAVTTGSGTAPVTAPVTAVPAAAHAQTDTARATANRTPGEVEALAAPTTPEGAASRVGRTARAPLVPSGVRPGSEPSDGAASVLDRALSASADPLAALLALAPAEVCRAAGKQAVRKVVERLPAAVLAALADGGAGVESACDLVPDGASLTISWPSSRPSALGSSGRGGVSEPGAGEPSARAEQHVTDLSAHARRRDDKPSARPGSRDAGPARPPSPGAGTRVVFVAPAGFAGMVVAGTRSTTEQAAARLEAVVRAFARQGRPWTWPHDVGADRDEGLTTAQRAAVEEVSAVVGQVVDAGLSHLGADAADALRGAAARARLVGLLLLHRLVLVAAGLVDALASRDDDVFEGEALGALAEVWALAAALRDAPVGTLPGLVGGPARRADAGSPAVDEAPGRLVPLGVRWWRTPGGSRGLTLTAWDTRHEMVRTATVGRPSGADPAFRRDMDLPLLWKASVAAVCAGPFELDGAEARPDGDLSTTSRTSHVSVGGFDVGELRRIAERLDAGGATGAVGFGRARRRAQLLMVRETGAIGVDEVRRDVTWPVTSADGVVRTLRIGVEHERSVEALLSVVASRRTVIAVLVEREPGAEVGEPVGIFLRTGQGSVELFAPSMSPSWRGTNWSALRRLTARIGALRRSSVAHVAERVAPGPVARVCEPALGVLDALGATGRRRLTDRQRDVLRVQARLAADLGMASVARPIEAVGDDTTTVTLLRARFVLGRAMALSDG